MENRNIKGKTVQIENICKETKIKKQTCKDNRTDKRNNEKEMKAVERNGNRSKQRKQTNNEGKLLNHVWETAKINVT